MKTAKEWFLTLPEPYGQMAIKNTQKEDERDGSQCLYAIYYSLSAAIASAFVWADSEEGYDFWEAIGQNAYYDL